MIPTTQRLLELVTGRVRKLLVVERARAMAGSLGDALARLAEMSRQTGRDSERVAIGLLRAELLDSNLQFEEAENVFQHEVELLARKLPDNSRYVIERNGVSLGQRLWKGSQNFYHMIDRERSAGIEWLDYQSLFQATQNAKAGEYYKSLPLLWQQLRRAYLSGCWFAQRMTSSLFVAQCSALGEWDTATHHLILSQDETLVRSVAEGITACGRPDLTHQVISRILKLANLKRHFVIGCRLLTELADTIPERDIASVADWLYLRASENRQLSVGPNVVMEAWKAIKTIGGRLDADRAEKWLGMTYANPIWTTRLNDPSRTIPERQYVVCALLPIASVLRESTEQMNRLAVELLPLLADSRYSTEYGEVLNLLCNVATWADEGTRANLGIVLFPDGKPVTYQLASVAMHFDKQGTFTPEILGRTALRVAEQIRLQVQRLKPGQKPVILDETLMQHSQANGELIVTVANFSGLAFLLNHRHSLSDESISLVVNAVLDLAADRENICENRTMMLHLIRDLTDRVDIEMRNIIVEKLQKLAVGPILESESGPTSADANNPLNPFKFNMGTPDDVQSMAIVALAAFAYPDKTLHPLLWPILTELCYDGRADIRRGAYAAARQCSTLDAGSLAGVLAGLRDPDPAASVSAFATVTDHPDWKLEKSQWLALLAAARFAARSPSAKLRRHAALTLLSRRSVVPRAYRRELESLFNSLVNDQAYSVRSACQIK